MGGFSLWHILIFAIIVLMLFGGNRFSAMMGDVAKGLKSFKAGMYQEDEAKQDHKSQRPAVPRQIPSQQTPIAVSPHVQPKSDDLAPPRPVSDDLAR